MSLVKSQNPQENKPQACPPCQSTMSTILSLCWTILMLIALYLSFKYNNGFDLGGFLAACCCSPFYIAYKLATGTCPTPAS